MVKCLPGSGLPEGPDTSAFGMCLCSGCAYQLIRGAKKNQIKLENEPDLSLLIKCPVFKPFLHTRKWKSLRLALSFSLPRVFVVCLVLLCAGAAHICTRASGSLSKSVYESFKVLYVWLDLNSSSSLQSYKTTLFLF